MPSDRHARRGTAVADPLNGGVGLNQSDREELPLEGFLFVRHNPSEEWGLIGGPGVGIIPGYGVPTFRAFFGVRYTPTAHDRDNDGVPDDEDKCPDIAEDRRNTVIDSPARGKLGGTDAVDWKIGLRARVVLCGRKL
jgi:hypothetical protein